jgi:hypothetical protein
LDASTHEHLWLNPRSVRKAPRKKVPYDGKPTLHAPGCESIARTEKSKPFKVPAITLNLFDRRDVWYCQNCLVLKSTARAFRTRSALGSARRSATTS